MPTDQYSLLSLSTLTILTIPQVTNKFQSYKSGIIKDTTCTGRPNHAVTAVGYTANYVLVKNRLYTLATFCW